MTARSPCMASSYSAAKRSAVFGSPISRRMSQTHLAQRTFAWQWRKTSAGRPAPPATAARTSRSRIPLQLQTYKAALRSISQRLA